MPYTNAHVQCDGLSAFISGLTGSDSSPTPFDRVLNPVLEIDHYLVAMEHGEYPVRCWFFIHLAAIGGLRDLARLNNGDDLDTTSYHDVQSLRTSPQQPCFEILSAMAGCDGLGAMKPWLESIEITAREEMAKADPRRLILGRMGYVPAQTLLIRH